METNALISKNKHEKIISQSRFAASGSKTDLASDKRMLLDRY